MSPRHRVVILGGGFAGLHAARRLRRAPVEVVLVDRRNFHCFQPLLYQVATGGLSPANITAPLRRVLRRQRNARVLMAEAVDVDLEARRVLLADGDELGYDSLVVAVGARYNYFGHDDWERHAPALKTVEDATRIRSRILYAFEAAEREQDEAARRAWLTFVIAGAGPTGVEMAGTLAEMARHSLAKDFRNFRPESARIVLVDGNERVLSGYPESLSDSARRSLEKLGVELRLGAMVGDVRTDGVTLRYGEHEEQLPCRTIMWAAGVRGVPLGQRLCERAGQQLAPGGRVRVGDDCTLPGYPAVFVLGDLAFFAHGDDEPLPGVAPVAIQQGRYVAQAIRTRLRGDQPGPFRYRDKGTMATVGRGKAVVDLHWLRFSGPLAWLTWLFVHLLYLVQFENRMLVLMQWCWQYLTFGRNARMITGDDYRAPAAGESDPQA